MNCPPRARIAPSNRFTLALAAALAALAILCAALPRQALAHSAEDAPIKVVFHADFADPRRFSAMLTSINNMVDHYKDQLLDYDIRIVFVAHGVRFLTDDPLTGTAFAEDAALAERRENLKGRLLGLNQAQGVKLELCEITRSQIGVAPEKLYPGVEPTPSGLVRIAELQRQGFAYIKIE